MKRTLFLLLLVLITGLQVMSQSDGSARKKQKDAEKKKQEQIKKQMKAEEKGRKKHYNIQSKDVKKRMRKNKRRYNHVDSFDRRPNFIQRIFPRKRPGQ
jgi:Na+-transporting methylmalonyl-CoA/oxaloacetate decarboxylase gamma subunit